MPPKKPQGQWRGLDALFLENSVDETAINQKTSLRIGLIEPKSGQPRKTFETEPLEQLAASRHARRPAADPGARAAERKVSDRRR